MALCAIERSLVTKNYDSVDVEFMDEYLSKLIPGYSPSQTKFKLFFIHQYILKKPFRLTGLITYVDKDQFELHVTKCDQFKNIGVLPTSSIKIFNVSEDIIKQAQEKMIFSTYCRVNIFNGGLFFCVHPNTHNKVRQHRRGDIDPVFIDNNPYFEEGN